MKRFSKNLLSLIGSDIGRRILGFFATAFLARTVGVDQFGAINIAFTVLSYGLMISTLGLSSYGARAVARGEAASIAGDISSLRLMNSIAVICITAAVTFTAVGGSGTAWLIFILSFSLIPNSLFVDWYFQGKEKMGSIGAGRVLSAVIYFGLILLTVRAPSDVLWVAVASVAGDVFSAIYMWKYYLAESAGGKIIFSLSRWKSMVAESLPIGYGGMLASLSINLPPLIIGILLTNSDVGIYSAAGKMVFFLLMIDRVLATVLLPATSRHYEKSIESLSLILNQALKWIVVTALPVCVGGAMLSRNIISLVFGPQYDGSAGVFQIFIWFFLVTMLHTVYTSGLIAMGKEKAYGVIMIISFVIYLASLIAGIALFGLIGAAVAVVFAESATLLLMRRRFNEIVKIRLKVPLPGIILSLIPMTIFLYIFPDISLFISVLIGAALYAGTLMVTRTITKNELNMLLEKL